MDIDEFGKVSLVNQSQSLKQLEFFCVIRAGQIAMANDSDEENYRLLLRGFTVLACNFRLALYGQNCRL